MKTKIKTILTTNNIKINNNVDALVFFDESTNHLIAISVNDFKKGNYNNAAVINKTSELAELGWVQLVNINTFFRKFPESNIDTYITAKHSQRVIDNFDLYVSAYIHLYRLYKSFETLTNNGLIGLIDTFIDYCIRENTDHPDTAICYFNYPIHKILKLRKVVFELFEPYLNNYSNYINIYNNQHTHKYTDKQFRAFAKTLKAFAKSQTVVKKSFLETFVDIHNNEIA